MGFKMANLQQWLTKYRMMIWWLIFLPLLLAILFFNRNLLELPLNVTDSPLDFPDKVFNTPVLIVLVRIVLIAVGLVIIMICLLFPLFRVGREGVQWTKELEEELVKASGEIAGEEIENLIKDESFRWSLIYNWIKLREPEPRNGQCLLRELLATIWEMFPNCRLSLCRMDGKTCRGVTHPLLAKLILNEMAGQLEDERTYGLQIQFSGDESLLLHIHTNFPEGFSQIDEKCLLVLGEIFLQKATQSGIVLDQLLANFDQILITTETSRVYDEGEVI